MHDYKLRMYRVCNILAVDIEPKVGLIVRTLLNRKSREWPLIIVISVEIIANTEDIRLVSRPDLYRFLPLMIATNPKKLSLVALAIVYAVTKDTHT